MKRLNVMISDEAKGILVKYQREHGLSTLDEATDAFLLEYVNGNGNGNVKAKAKSEDNAGLAKR